MWADCLEQSGSHPRDRIHLGQRTKPSQAVALPDDPPGQSRSDLGQPGQFGHRGLVEVDPFVRRERPGQTGRGRPMPGRIGGGASGQEFEPTRSLGRTKGHGPQRMAQYGNHQQRGNRKTFFG